MVIYVIVSEEVLAKVVSIDKKLTFSIVCQFPILAINLIGLIEIKNRKDEGNSNLSGEVVPTGIEPVSKV
jgi:hypothetical protein